MWIFTKDGFYSAVQHNEIDETLQIRARKREDLQNLAHAVGLNEVGIIEIDDADYRWRMNVNRDLFAQYVATEVHEISYTTNVKGNLAHGDPERSDAMMDVWRAMYRLQERPTIVRRS